MRPIPAKHRQIIDSDPYFRVCARAKDGGCQGRMTVEHAFLYANRQISELWNYVPLCFHHHLGEGLDKNKNQLIALSRATPEDLAKYPHGDWSKRLRYLQHSIKTKA